MANEDEQTNLKPATDQADQERDDTKELGVTVKDIGPGRKCLTIEVPANRIAGKIHDSYNRLKSESVVPGFRRGRAPRRLIERRFSTSVQGDVRGELISECFTQAIEEEKLDVIGEPDIKDPTEIKLPDDGPMTFKIEVEVAPTIELPDLEGIAITKKKVEVTDKNVEDQIKHLGEQFGQPVEVEGGTVSVGDYLITNTRILADQDADDDAPLISHHPGTNVRVPGPDQDYKGHVAGIVVDNLGKQLTHKMVGDAIRISMTGPTGHENERIRNKLITIVLQIDGIRRIKPADVDVLVDRFDLDTTDRLQQYVRSMLETRSVREQQNAMHQQIRDHFLDKIELELPEGLTTHQTERLLRRRALELASLGMPEHEIEQRVAEARTASEQEAQRDLKLFFILNQAAKYLGIEVSDEEINGYIATLAVEQRRRPEKLRQQMQRSGELENVKLLISERKTLNQILEKANVEEVESTSNQDAADPQTADSTGNTKKKGKKKTTTKKRPPRTTDATS